MTRIPVRFLLVLSTFSLTLLLYIDRAAISAAKGSISTDLNLSDTEMGWVMSAFALGYALFQVPSGMLVDFLGPRKIITLIVAVWSFFTILTGAAWNYVSLLIMRFLFGGGEAGAFPSIARANFSWIPLNERGIITGINFSGSRLGAAFAFPLVTWMVTSYGWRIGFLVMGCVGLVWAVFWYFWFTDQPEDHPSMPKEEKELIATTRQQSTQASSQLPFSVLIKNKNIWLLMGQYFGSNFIFFFCLTWMFPYLKERFNISSMDASIYSMFPLIAGAVGNWISGFIIDLIYKKGHWKLSRSLPAILGFTFVGFAIIGILTTTDVGIAVVFLSLAVFGADMTLSPSWSLCVDIGKTNAGTVSGTMNMAGNMGSFITGIAFPYLILWTGTSDTFFYLAFVWIVLSILAWLSIDPTKPITNHEGI